MADEKNDETIADGYSDTINMPEDAVARVEITLFRDGSIKTAAFPTESSAVTLLMLALDMYGYEATASKRGDLEEGCVQMTSMVDRTATILAMASNPAEA